MESSRSSRPLVITALLLAAIVAAASAFLVCGKKTTSSSHSKVSLDGTYCALIEKAAAPQARARGPLPDDPVLAAWTERVESATEQYLAVIALSQAHDRRVPLARRDIECARRLRDAIDTKMPPGSRIRRYAMSDVERLLSYSEAGTAESESPSMEEGKEKPGKKLDASTNEIIHRLTEADSNGNEPECRSTKTYLAAFPSNVADNNARFRRALLLHFNACVEDNFNSIDGELDKQELFMRATAESWPERLGIDFELIVGGDPNAQDAARFTWMWLRNPFGRITLDLGETGNALRVVRDLSRGHPEIPKALLPTAKKVASSAVLPSHRKARWVALVDYLEAGAPDPGEPMEPAITRALESGDARSARWALAFIPNELQEHAPRPHPLIRDPALVAAIVKRAEAVVTGVEPPLKDEEIVLLLDVVSRTPVGTLLPWMVRLTSSPNDSVWLAAIAAMNRQVEQLTTEEQKQQDSRDKIARDWASTHERTKFLTPHVAGLRAGLASHVCEHQEALHFLVAANDTQIDNEVATCLALKDGGPDTNYLQGLFGACLDHPDLGWSRTAGIIEASAKRGDDGYYSRRVANGCRTGKD